MLVLSRKRGESIIVGDDIEIRVLEVHGNQVKIGVQAPPQHSVHRKEVYLAIRGKAAQPSAGPPKPARTIEPSQPPSPPHGSSDNGNGQAPPAPT